MSKVVIEIETDNDAFADGNIGQEVQRILSKILWQTSSNIKTGWELKCSNPKLKDINGNNVGQVKIKN